MFLKIQEFISCFDDNLDAYVYLKRNLNIETSIHTLEGESDKYKVVLFKPGMKADMTNPIVKEANCLVLDGENEVYAKAWDHPCVIREPGLFPGSFNLSGAVCEEVPDGKVVVVYNIDGRWFIAPTLDCEEEIKKCLNHSPKEWYRSFEHMNPFLCFMFNFVSPDAKSIMPILNPELYLTGVINLDNNIEMSNGTLNTLAETIGVARPGWTEINGSSSLSQRLLNMRALAPGLMLRDKQDNRVFIPNPIHNAVRSAKEAGDRVRPTHIAKILQACRDKADVVAISAAYDVYGPMLELLRSRRFELTEEVLMLWSVARHSLTATDFALAVQHHPLRYLLFLRRHNKATDLVDEVENLKPIKLTRLTKNKYEKEYSAASKLLRFTGGTDGDSEIEKIEDWGSEEDEEDS